MYTKNGGKVQRRDRGHICVVCHALLLASALLDCPTATHISLASPSLLALSEQTATSLRARCGHGVRKRRAEAREATRPRRPSCSATRSCPLPTRSLPRPPYRPSPRPRNSIAARPAASRAFGPCARALAADASAVDGCIRSTMGHRMDATVELRLLERACRRFLYDARGRESNLGK